MKEKQPILNKLSVWRSVPAEAMYSKKYTSNRTYSDNGSLSVASIDSPVYAYAKNYKKSKLDFCLFMYSTSDDIEAVEKFFDASAKKVKTQEVADALTVASGNNFKYIELYFKEK